MQEGHILAVEYLEETPLMLGRPGMGLKLNTFYRRKHERDAGHLDIRKGPQSHEVFTLTWQYRAAAVYRIAKLALCRVAEYTAVQTRLQHQQQHRGSWRCLQACPQAGLASCVVRSRKGEVAGGCGDSTGAGGGGATVGAAA